MQTGRRYTRDNKGGTAKHVSEKSAARERESEREREKKEYNAKC